MMRSFGEEIWIAGGPEREVLGFRYPTRMAVIRLADGGLFLWSPVALTEALRREIEALGAPRFLVAPNSLHHMFLADWRRAYPEAKLFAAPGLRRKRPDLAFDAELGEAPPPGWAGEIEQALMPSNLITTEIVFFHMASGTVLFTDLLQQFEPGWFTGWRALVARLDLMVGRAPEVPRKFRLAFANRRAARAAVDRILGWPSEKLLMAHGAPVEQAGREAIARAFRWL